jgi:hypothetical protein
MGLVWRALSAGIGAFIAIGINTYFTFRSGAVFDSDRWKLTVSIGLFCAVVYGALVLLADELPSRLRGFWPWWSRLIASVLFGLGIGAALWALWTYLYLGFTLDTNLALFAGAGAGIGYVASTMLNLPGWVGLIVTAIATYIPLYATFTGNTPVLYYDYPEQIFSLTIPLAVIMAIGGFAPKLLHSLSVWLDKRPRKVMPLPMPQRVSELGVRAPLVLDPDATEVGGKGEPTPSRVAPRITRPVTAGSNVPPRLTRPNVDAGTQPSPTINPTAPLTSAPSPLKPSPLRPTSRLQKPDASAAPETPTSAASDALMKTMTDTPSSAPLKPAPLRPKSSRLRRPGESEVRPATDEAMKTITDAPASASKPLRPAPLRISRPKQPDDSVPTTDTPTSAAPADAMKTMTDAPASASKPLRPAPLRPASRPNPSGDSAPTTDTPTSAAPADAMKTITDAPSALPKPLRPAPLRPASQPKRAEDVPSEPESPPEDESEE